MYMYIYIYIYIYKYVYIYTHIYILGFSGPGFWATHILFRVGLVDGLLPRLLPPHVRRQQIRPVGIALTYGETSLTPANPPCTFYVSGVNV